jgi:hypothetical protein
VRGVPFPGFYFWLKLRKSSADSSYTGRERRFLRDAFGPSEEHFSLLLERLFSSWALI